MMKPFSILSLYFFSDVYRNKNINWKNYAFYTLSLTVATLFKPSFVFCFAPTLLIFLVYDFINTRLKNVRNEIILGCSVLPSIVIFVWQSTQLFDESRKMVFGLFEYLLLLHKNNIILVVFSLLGSLGFSLMTIWSFRENIKSDISYSYISIMLVISLLQFFFVNETGEYLSHGNLIWSSMISNYIVILYGLIQMINKYKEGVKYNIFSGLVFLIMCIMGFVRLIF